MLNDFPRGSEWRKWDLHFHTPSSFDYEDKSITNDQIIQSLLDNQIRVVAVTDHHTIDIDRINKLRALANGRITIFPGIELRSELGGSESVHFIGIFSDMVDISSIWITLQGQCGLTPLDLKNQGDDKIFAPFEKTARLIRELGGIVTVHAGKKTNSIENISNSLSYKQAIKTYLANELIDVYELGSEKDMDGYIQHVFPAINKRLPMILCSDNHHANNYSVKQDCWLKSDPTFEGLKHALNEPEARIHIGVTPQKVEIVNSNLGSFIDKVTIKKNTDSKIPEPWFNSEIELNSDLVAIIGNKGSGKSALADIIGLTGSTKNSDCFSFLRNDRFRKPPINPSAGFYAEMKWRDSSLSRKKLSDTIESSEVERVKYLPQRFIETVCNELGEEFQTEINKMVFSYLPEDEKLGRKSFEDLISHLCSTIDERIRGVQVDISNANSTIIKCEKKDTPEYRKEVENLVKLKLKELSTHIANQPVPVNPPKIDPANKQHVDEIATMITGIEAEIRTQQGNLNILTNKISELDILKSKVLDFSKAFDILKSETDRIISDNNLEIDIKLNFNYDISVVDSTKNLLSAERNTLQATLESKDSKWTDASLFKKLQKLTADKKALEGQMTVEQQKYQKYLNDLKNWHERRKEIVGSSSKPDSLKAWGSELLFINKRLLTILKGEYANRDKLLKDLYKLKLEKVCKYEQVYRSVLEFINTTKKKDDDSLNFTVQITPTKTFIDDFLGNINQSVSSVFKGLKDGRQNLIEMIRHYDFSIETDLIDFINEIYTQVTREKNKVDSLLKDRQKFYNYLYFLDYLKVEYRLSLGTIPLEQLSPGEKGALLLIFYLVLDKSNNPLVIDQPEDNLDNHSVFKRLVPFIKESKNKRQIIIVTHNPNLAVACDAEQVIHAEMDKQDYKLTYQSGSIENPAINKCIVDVLEGTMPAFSLRQLKYMYPNT